MTRSFRLPLFLSLGAHGAFAVALAAASGGAGTSPASLPGRVQAVLSGIVEVEPDPAPPPADLPLPEVRDPLAEAAPVVDEAPLPEPVDERLVRVPSPTAAGSGNPWGGDGVIGVGPGGPPGRRVRLLRPSPAAPASAAAPAPHPEAVPPPAGPTARARPIPGSCPAPAYPARARRLGVEGAVELTASVDAAGSVDSTAVASSSGDASLDAAAVDAVGRWRFEPALRDGLPVPDEYGVRFLFRLDDRAAFHEESP